MPYAVLVQIALSYSINSVTAQCRKPGRRLRAKLQTDGLPCRVAAPEKTRVGASQRLAKFAVRVNNVFWYGWNALPEHPVSSRISGDKKLCYTTLNRFNLAALRRSLKEVTCAATRCC